MVENLRKVKHWWLENWDSRDSCLLKLNSSVCWLFLDQHKKRRRKIFFSYFRSPRWETSNSQTSCWLNSRVTSNSQHRRELFVAFETEPKANKPIAKVVIYSFVPLSRRFNCRGFFETAGRQLFRLMNNIVSLWNFCALWKVETLSS